MFSVSPSTSVLCIIFKIYPHLLTVLSYRKVFMMAFAFKILIIVGSFTACCAYSWMNDAPYNGSAYYACLGDSITIPWSIITSGTERVTEMEWFFSGTGDDNSEAIATYVNGEFFVPHSTRQRLFFTENVGLIISSLTHEDYGKYSVRVDISSSSSSVTEARYAYLRQPVSPSTQDQLLHARVLPKAAYSSGDWHVQLACGTFNNWGSSSFSVKWKTPSGRLLNSDSSSGYNYILTLTYPIEEGTYSCFIEIHEPAARCVYVPPSMLVSNDIHVDDCSAQRAQNNARKQEIEDMASAFQQFVMTGSDTVRLVNGSRPWNGRVEVKYNGTWGAVCSGSYTSSTARVVCKMLGLSQDASSPPQIFVGSLYGTSKLPALLGYASCNGNEASIFNCSINYNGQSCNRVHDIVVDCWPRFTTN